MVMRVYITYALYLLLLPLLLLIHRGEGSFEDEHRLTRDNIARIGQTKLMMMLYSQVSSSPILAFRWLEPRINVDGIQHCRRSWQPTLQWWRHWYLASSWLHYLHWSRDKWIWIFLQLPSIRTLEHYVWCRKFALVIWRLCNLDYLKPHAWTKNVIVPLMPIVAVALPSKPSNPWPWVDFCLLLNC